MSLESKNITFLNKHYPHIYKMLLVNKGSHYDLVENSTGFYNIRCSELDDALLYSKFNPTYEAQRWCESLSNIEDTDEDIILFGLGLTYHLASLIERYPNRKIIIFEPEVQLFAQMMKVIDVSELLTHINVKYIAVGNDEETIRAFGQFIKLHCTMKYYYTRIPFYEKISLQTEKLILEKIKKIDLERKSLQGFHEIFGKQMFQNTLRNIPKLLETPVLKTLENCFPESTAVIVGGGPSLEFDIEYLKENAQNWLIIAAGSSIQSLQHHGIEPHLVVSMDPGIFNARIFQVNSYKEIPMLLMPQIHSEIMNLHNENNIYAYYDNDPIINYFIPYQDKNYIMRPTYSVTGTAIQAAIYMGAGRIIFTGQDLSYPNKQQYASGATHINDTIQKRVEKEFIYEVENVNGAMNSTSFSMLQTLKNIEELIAKYNDITFINSSRLGASIKGTNFISMREINKNDTLKTYRFTDIKDYIHFSAVMHEVDKNLLLRKAELIIQYIHSLTTKLSRIENSFNELIILVRRDSKKSLSLLKKIDSSLNEIINREIFINFISHWFRVELDTFEQKLLAVMQEGNLSTKAELYRDVVNALFEALKKWLPVIANELNQLVVKLNNN